MPSCDVIVIGAGVNGLACAGLLAKQGRNVLVCEASDAVGGAAATVEFAPGFRVPHVAHILNQLDDRVVKELALERHGLAYAATDLASVALDRDGRHLVLEGAFGERIDGDLSSADRKSFAALRARLLRFSALLGALKPVTPPRLGGGSSSDLMTLGKLGLSLRRLGGEEMREFLRLALINVADLLEDELGDDRLKGLVAFDAVLGSRLGPRSPNSLMSLYYRLSGSASGKQASLALPRVGMGAVAEALRRGAEAAGAAIRTGAPVKRIEVTDDRVSGVLLQSGETVSAPLVVSAADPRRTFIGLVGPRHFDTGFVRRVNNIRMRGNAAKLHLALSALPDFRGLPAARLNGRLVIAPSIRAVETAFDPSKYGEASPQPVMEIILPSVSDPSLAPAGKHVLSAIVQFAPYDLKGGWEQGRAPFLAKCMAVLEAYAPGIGGMVEASELVTPADLEARYRLTGGHWHHGELAVDQMLMLRPIAGAAQYSTPLPGLWLASAGSHPGGGVSGTPGANAAAAILAAEKSR